MSGDTRETIYTSRNTQERRLAHLEQALLALMNRVADLESYVEWQAEARHGLAEAVKLDLEALERKLDTVLMTVQAHVVEYQVSPKDITYAGEAEAAEYRHFLEEEEKDKKYKAYLDHLDTIKIRKVEEGEGA